jgi:Ca-activated chloride channel family protein
MSPWEVAWFGIPLRLAEPERWPWLVGVAVVALAAVAWGAHRRRQAAARLSASAALREVVLEAGPRWEGARAALSVAGACLVALALLRPQVGERGVWVRERGIDLVVAVDASRSMTARDVLPSRLERARLELGTLFDRLGGDRVGLVAFAGDAFVQCPLTTDRGAAKLFLRAIDPEAMPSQGTAIARALEVSGAMLAAAEEGATSQVVLLLSDGEDHSGKVEAATARLKEQGVRVFTWGIGSPTGTPLPIVDARGQVVGYRKDRDGKTVLSRLDDRQLRAIAAATGGSYFPAVGSDLGVGRIVDALQGLEQTERDGRLATEWGEVFRWVALPGFLLLWTGAILPVIGVARRGRR